MNSQELPSLLPPRFAAAVAVLGLTACSTPVPAPPGGWTMQASATSGAALIRTEHGSETLRIACRRNPADLWVAAPRLAGGGNGPVRLQVGDAVFDLQAGVDEPGLTAMSVLSAAFPAALTANRAIVLHRGGSVTATFPAPDAATRDAFAAACRKALQNS